jgi:preprotein translocase subunit SecG
MLYYVLATVYVVVCLLMMVVILLQQGRGDVASAFGGAGTQTAFGARQGATVLTKATTVLGALFMIGALLLAVVGQRGPGSLLRGLGAPKPAQQSAPAKPAPQTPPTSQEQGAAPQEKPAGQPPEGAADEKPASKAPAGEKPAPNAEEKPAPPKPQSPPKP